MLTTKQKLEELIDNLKIHNEMVCSIGQQDWIVPTFALNTIIWLFEMAKIHPIGVKISYRLKENDQIAQLFIKTCITVNDLFYNQNREIIYKKQIDAMGYTIIQWCEAGQQIILLSPISTKEGLVTDLSMEYNTFVLPALIAIN